MTTTEEVIRLAREAGVRVIADSKFNRDDYTSVQSSFPALVRLIDLAKAEENEACAKECDELHYEWNFGEISGPRQCAESIRARRNHG